MIMEATESDRKRIEFVSKLKDKPYACDVFNRAIRPGDILIFGTGTQSAAGLNFGLVEKFNYKIANHRTYNHEKNSEYVSSVTVKVAKVWNDNIRLQNRRGLASFKEACILDNPPEDIMNVFIKWEEDNAKPKSKR
jgi:hypothetical protein